jgi:hypothetical protein
VRQFSLTRPADKVRTPGPQPRQTPTTGHSPPDGQNPAQTARSPGTHCRAIATRISASLSLIRSPDKSTVTVCSVPLKGNGAR